MRYLFYTIIFLLVLILLYKSENRKDDFVINTIIRGCARWASASLQDKSPLIAVLHANYASGYLWALKDTFSDEDIKRSSGIDIIKFQKRITGIQDASTKRMISACPKYASDIDMYLGKIAGMN